MSAPIAFCPQCRTEVAFVQLENLRRCPVCGFEFETVRPGEKAGQRGRISGWGVLLRFILVTVAIILVTLAVVFVGCVASLKGL